MENLVYIESYFKGNNTAEEKQQFENKILDDADFAADVAFYISAQGVIIQQLNEEKKQGFRQIYNNDKVVTMKPRTRSLWKYMAAASVIIAVLLTWFFTGNNKSPHQLADNYIQENFQTLNVTMGNGDSLQTGINLYNAGKLNEALIIFNRLDKKVTSNSEAIKYTGIVYLRLRNYDKALQSFSLLEADTALYSNPGKFYKAITLLQRNNEGDYKEGKQLLHEVVDRELEGKTMAIKWLKNF